MTKKRVEKGTAFPLVEFPALVTSFKTLIEITTATKLDTLYSEYLWITENKLDIAPWIHSTTESYRIRIILGLQVDFIKERDGITSAEAIDEIELLKKGRSASWIGMARSYKKVCGFKKL
jgi:hypothetical protein